MVFRASPPGREYASENNLYMISSSITSLTKAISDRAKFCLNQADTYRDSLNKYTGTEGETVAMIRKKTSSDNNNTTHGTMG